MKKFNYWLRELGALSYVFIILGGFDILKGAFNIDEKRRIYEYLDKFKEQIKHTTNLQSFILQCGEYGIEKLVVGGNQITPDRLFALTKIL